MNVSAITDSSSILAKIKKASAKAEERKDQKTKK
jgi:hypothetical protein